MSERVTECGSVCVCAPTLIYTLAYPTHPHDRTSPSQTGGADKTAIVFHKDSKQIIATLKGHTKKVTGAVYHPREVHTVTKFSKLYTHIHVACTGGSNWWNLWSPVRP